LIGVIDLNFGKTRWTKAFTMEKL